MDHPLYGKKKKKLTTRPNPLFEQWLLEWKNDAAEKNMKSQHTYGKALKSLQKFPLRLECGKDCKILENFGDKICKMLDDRLDKHIAEFGTAAPVTMVTEDEDVPPPKKTKPSKPKSPKAKGKLVQAAVPLRTSHEMSDSNDEELPHLPRKREANAVGGEKEYIPQYRSGPYALLITLYKELQTPNSLGHLSKNDLVSKAQSLADKSFTLPDPGCRYTAWSSMGSLIKKGLVIKEGSPARYSLTDAGCQLTHRLEAVTPAGTDDTGFRVKLIPHNSPVAMTTEFTPPVLPSMPQTGNIVARAAVGGEKKSLTYWYITEDGSETLEKDKTVISISDDLEVGFLVKCCYNDLVQSGKQYRLDTSRPVVRDYVYAYLSNNDTADLAPATLPCPVSTLPGTEMVRNTSLDSTRDNSTKPAKDCAPQLSSLSNESSHAKKKVIKSSSRFTSAIVIDTDDSSTESLPSISHFTDRNVKQLPTTVTNDTNESNRAKDNTSVSLLERLKNKSGALSNATCKEFLHKPEELNPELFNNATSHQSLSRLDCVDSQDSCQSSIVSSQNSIKSLTSEDSAASQQSSYDTSFVLYPGMFDIVLCIDNAEFYGASKGGSKTLLPDLIKNGVNCDLRKLHVGDILWVAREKTLPRLGEQGRGQGRELVLNYVIERKRMDDLVSSCIDGRFKEQKFRLKKCGLQNPMYLIEDYGSTKHFSLPEATIKQAIANTQVIDGFQVKRTRDTKETVAYLTVFTRYLQSCFTDKTLYACNLEDIKDTKIKCKIDDLEQRLPVFGEFNQSSVKTKSLTIQEMFGKQLIQLHGMSAEKARAIIELCPTLQHLLRAYDKCKSEKEKENMLATIKCGKTLRSLGLTQSRQIYQLYNIKTPLV